MLFLRRYVQQCLIYLRHCLHKLTRDMDTDSGLDDRQYQQRGETRQKQSRSEVNNTSNRGEILSFTSITYRPLGDVGDDLACIHHY